MIDMKVVENEYNLMKNILSIQNKLSNLQELLNEIFNALLSPNIDIVKLVLNSELKKMKTL